MMLKTLAVSCVLSLAAVATAQTTYTILEGGAPGCSLSGINDGSDLAGQCNAAATDWRAGVAAALGKLPKGTYSTAVSINSKGVAVGNGDAGDGRPHATLYRNGAVTDIDSSAANAYAIRIGESGVIAGNYLKGFGGCNNWAGAIWVEDISKPGVFRRTDLPAYPGGDGKVRCQSMSAANASTQAVGMVQSSLFGQNGAFWNNDAKRTLSLLVPFSADWSSYAWAINDLGQAAGESHPPFGSRPVVWNNDAAHTPIELPLLPGDNYGSATAINNLGHVLGTSAYAVPNTWNVGPARFVIWRDGGVFELQSLLEPITGAGWTITGVSGINNRGQIIGSGVHNGRPMPFVMTPSAQ